MIEDFLQRGLLSKGVSDKQKAVKSLEIAESKIEKAHQELEAELFDDALVSAYTAMFHTSRALLFKDGFKERSHYALCEYIREKYGGKLESRFINELNVLRTIRHKLMYGDEDLNVKEVQEVESLDSINLAEEYLKAVKKLI